MRPLVYTYFFKPTLIIIFFLTTTQAWAQQAVDTLRGKVVIQIAEEEEVIAIGAKLAWLNSNKIFYTNPLGEFAIPIFDTQIKTLFVRHISAKPDSIKLKGFDKEIEIVLSPKTSKRVATITAKTNSTKINYLNPVLTININKQELLKAACCNLSESFETTPSVDVAYSDAITGQKQIQMLGLAGPYTTITQENIPNIRGLASVEGLNYTPGTWVDGIQLSKGTGSVVNGFESLAGQINVELQKPDKAEKFFVNLYQSNQGRSEANIHLNKNYGRFAHGLLLHYKNQWLKQDNNKDNFLDNPLGNQLVNMYRWQYFSPSGFEWQGGLKAINTKSRNNQITYTMPQWLYSQNTDRVEAFMKFGKVFPKKQWKSIGFQIAGFMHSQNVEAGLRKYDGKQQNLYGNFIFQNNIGNSNHSIKTGASLILDKYQEVFPDTVVKTMARNENTTGVFVEHTYNYLKTLNIVTGLRADYNNLYGMFYTPRLHIRYVPFRKHTIRASIGRAQRTASVLAENQKAYFSGRQFVFIGKASDWQNGINQEVAWNTGISYSLDFEINYRKVSWVTDYYYSWFKKQIVADYETLYQVNFYNLQGKSYAHSFQTQIDYSPFKRADIRIAYRLYDVKTQYQQKLLEKPLVSKHRAFINLAYATKNKWRFDATYNFIGQKRISDGYALTGNSLNYSPNYSLINFHLAKSFKNNFEIYAGGENVNNFMQHHAIISSLAPFDKSFDASQIWGPVMGSNYYIGLRFGVK